MKKETFVSIVNALKRYSKECDCMCEDIKKTVKKYKKEQMDFFDVEALVSDWKVVDTITEALAKDFNYESAENDLNYWFYDCSFGEMKCILELNKVGHLVTTAEELYDFMKLSENYYETNRK